MSYTLGAFSTKTIASPTGTTTTANFVFQGLAAFITPKVSGKVFIIVTGNCTNNTNNKGISIKGKYGTGTAPTNGTTEGVIGTQFGGISSVTQVNLSSSLYYFSICANVTGLTIGTAYWIDLAIEALSSGTASISGIVVSIIEQDFMIGKAFTVVLGGNPTGSTNVFPGVMMGLGSSWNIIPTKTGRVLAILTGVQSCSTSGSGGATVLYHGTGTPPSNQAAPTGSSFGSLLSLTAVQGNSSNYPMNQSGVVTGLAIGTNAWFDIDLNTTAGTSSVGTLSMLLIEF